MSIVTTANRHHNTEKPKLQHVVTLLLHLAEPTILATCTREFKIQNVFPKKGKDR